MSEQESDQRLFPVNFGYAIDVGPMLPGSPKRGHFWLGFEWQPEVRRWMAHHGREHKFRLLAPETLRTVIHEALSNGLVVVSCLARYRRQQAP